MCRRLALVVVVLLACAVPAHAQATGSGQAAAVAPDTPDDDTIEAGESGSETPRRRLIRWNEYEGPFFTIRVGGGVLLDYATFSQDEESAQQVEATPGGKLRDARVLLKGRLKFRRPVTWSSGLM